MFIFIFLSPITYISCKIHLTYIFFVGDNDPLFSGPSNFLTIAIGDFLMNSISNFEKYSLISSLTIPCLSIYLPPLPAGIICSYFSKLAPSSSFFLEYIHFFILISIDVYYIFNIYFNSSVPIYLSLAAYSLSNFHMKVFCFLNQT